MDANRLRVPLNLVRMPRGRSLRAGVVACASAAFLLVGGAPIAVAQDFEVPGKRKASEILPTNWLAGPHYRVEETVVSYGYMHHWTVTSDYGTFKATGDGALRKLLLEIAGKKNRRARLSARFTPR